MQLHNIWNAFKMQSVLKSIAINLNFFMDILVNGCLMWLWIICAGNMWNSASNNWEIWCLWYELGLVKTISNIIFSEPIRPIKLKENQFFDSTRKYQWVYLQVWNSANILRYHLAIWIQYLWSLLKLYWTIASLSAGTASTNATWWWESTGLSSESMQKVFLKEKIWH